MDVTKKHPAREQRPEDRVRNFSEVSLGYDEETALAEAQRCLHCKNSPCMSACPVNVNIPDFIALVKEKKYLEAYDVIRATSALPAICGRVCPQENQCESKCVRGIKGESVGIGRLERFVADYAMDHGAQETDLIPENGVKVAVIGSGPAGLSCAGDLRRRGYAVTVFEALHTPGGVLVYGIPEFRLPKKLVRAEIAKLEKMGVEIRTDTVVGRTVTLDELLEEEGFAAAFIGSGAGLPRFQGIPGENLNGVYSANEFLTRVNLMRAYEFPNSDTPVRCGKRVAVVGGGNVAMDAARCALRLGAEEVSIVYRRSQAEMPARQEEIHHAAEEGVRFCMLTNPVRILGDADGAVQGMECVSMELGEPDASGRRRPVPKAGSEHVLDVDTVIIAIGNSPNPLIRNTTPGLETTRWGGIVVQEETMETSRENVYAGGDAVTGAATVILAMGAGKAAARAIHEKLGKS
ncbi:MAG: NADPH-dependent glutamate synthase [Clostridiales bacterium]|nr:NADPH-dependent glutamate synthase [Clostridiales bacterium]